MYMPTSLPRKNSNVIYTQHHSNQRAPEIMAAIASPWAKPGAWALDSEEQDSNLLEQGRKYDSESSNSTIDSDRHGDFPSLAAAAASKSSKKKKAQTLSLAEFNSGVAVSRGSARLVHGLTKDEILHLPTGPRERTAEELDRSRLGRGFRYDSSRSSRYSDGDNYRFGNSRVSDEGKRPGGYERGDFVTSRADEIDNWGAAKKTMAGSGYEGRERGGFLDSHSRADESDNWASRKTTSMPFDGPRYGLDREKRGGFESFSRDSSSGAASDLWGRKKEEGSVNGGSGRPKLNLQPRTLPVSNGHQGAGLGSRSRGSNPFGEARPREEILAEKGQDWKKIDEQLDSMKINESEFASNGKTFEKWSSGDGSWKTERSWRNEAADIRPSSAGNSESNGES